MNKTVIIIIITVLISVIAIIAVYLYKKQSSAVAETAAIIPVSTNVTVSQKNGGIISSLGGIFSGLHVSAT